MIKITEQAKEYLNSVRPDDGHITLGVNGGGCAGFTYKWGTTDEWTEKDVETNWIEVEDILLVDPVCELYILGSQFLTPLKLTGSGGSRTPLLR